MKIQFNFSTIAFAICVVLLIWLFIDKCNGCNHDKPTGDTIKLKIDTVYKQSVKDTLYVPKIISKTVYQPKFDTLYLETETIKDVDSAAILKDYLTHYIYSDTQLIQYGNVIINDTVFRNKIQKRRLIVNQNVPVVTKTVTLSQPRKNILYFSLSTQYFQYDGSLGLGAGLMLKLRNDKAIEVDYLLNSHNQQAYQLFFKFPIKLRK